MGFLKFSFIDLLDIVLVGLVMYYIYKLLRGTVAIPIFIGIFIVFSIYQITLFLEMKLLSDLLGLVVGGGTIALLIIFHPELRKFLLMIGSTKFGNYYDFFKNFKFLKSKQSVVEDLDIEMLTNVCERFAENKTGALMVFEGHGSLDYLKETGVSIKAALSEAILRSIFYKNSPLHDGAIIIRKNTIIAARVVLPVSQKKMKEHYGLRHKAAMGISEQKDAFCLVVSEETGTISAVKKEQIRTISPQNIKTELIDFFEN